MVTVPYLSALTAAILAAFLLPKCNSYLVDNNPYRHIEVLDPDGKYELEWLVDWEESRVIFNITVKTKGYIGFGLSQKGKMSGADIVIGGVLPNGKPYFTDRHAIGNQLPELDESQDWTLHSAWESGTHTFLSFSRPFDTCDEDHDLPIHDDVISLLWAYGEKDDEIEYHYQNRGMFEAYLLDPDLVPRTIQPAYRSHFPKVMGDLKVWTIEKTQVMPANKDTTYICTIHKVPRHSSKQHIVGFNSILESDIERRHIHHFLLHRCNPPPGQDAARLFERHAEGRGEECYILNMPTGRIPTQYCREVVHVWEVNGKPVFFPEHAGIPMSESPNEYFMLQMHYDNPEQIPGIQLKFALEVFYTGNVRKHDAAVLTIGEQTPASPSIMIPPSSLSHVIYGQCGAGCTETMFPPDGIHVFAVNLHTHLAGRGVRLLHIRNNRELPWISYDDNYNFNYQQVRILRKERTVLPGDILINRCVYENTERNGSVTIGGFSTRHEMCNGFLWYYNKLPNYGICRSEIRADVYKDFVEVWNTTWSDARIENIVTAPSKHAGLTVSEVGTNRLSWTIERRNQIQKYHRYLPQITQCPIIVETDRSTSSLSQSPSLQRYSIKGGRRTSKGVISSSTENANEFVTIYPKDIIPYERPQICDKKKHDYI